MSRFTQFQICQYRQVYDAFKSSLNGLNVADLMSALCQFGPSIGEPTVLELFNKFTTPQSASILGFPEFLELLSVYQLTFAQLKEELNASLQYFLKKKQKLFGYLEVKGFGKQDLRNVLSSGPNPLTPGELNTVVADAFALDTVLAPEVFVRNIASDSLCWQSTNYDFRTLGRPPTSTILVRVTDIDPLTEFTSVKYMAGQGIAFDVVDPFLRIQCWDLVAQTPIAVNQSRPTWNKEIEFVQRFAEIDVGEIQRQIETQAMNFYLMDAHLPSLQTKDKGAHEEWMATGSIPLVTILGQSLGTRHYNVELNAYNAKKNVILRVAITVRGPPLSCLFTWPEEQWLMNGRTSLVSDLDGAAIEEPSATTAGVAAGTYVKKHLGTHKSRDSLTHVGDESLVSPRKKTSHSIDATTKQSSTLRTIEKFYKRYRKSFPRRHIRLIAKDDHGKFHLMPSFLGALEVKTPGVPPNTFQDMAVDIARFRSSSSSLRINATVDISHQVSSIEMMLLRGRATELERCLFLCSLMLGRGERTYVASGWGHHSRKRFWVINFPKDGAVQHWCTIEGRIIDPPKRSFVSLDCMWNRSNIWANIQERNKLDEVSVDIEDQDAWLALFKHNHAFPSTISFHCLLQNFMPEMPDRETTRVLVNAIQNYRQSAFAVQTSFYRPTCRKFLTLMKEHKHAESLHPNLPSSARDLFQVVSHILPAHYICHFRTFVFRNDSVEDIIHQLQWSGLLNCAIPDAIYSISVHTVPYLWGLRITYVIIGYLYDVNTVLFASNNLVH